MKKCDLTQMARSRNIYWQLLSWVTAVSDLYSFFWVRYKAAEL